MRITNQDIVDRANKNAEAARLEMARHFDLQWDDFEDAIRELREEAGRDWDRATPYICDSRMEKIIALAKLPPAEDHAAATAEQLKAAECCGKVSFIFQGRNYFRRVPSTGVTKVSGGKVRLYDIGSDFYFEARWA